MLDDHELYTVTDLKQFTYCARVVFYERCLPNVRPRTFKMDAGRDAHKDEQKRANRRTLAGYALVAGERQFDVAVTVPDLKLTGKIDEVVYAADGEVFPVDYKLARKVSPNHRLQIAAYGLMLETVAAQSVRRGFIYLIPPHQMIEVPLTDALRDQVRELLNRMEYVIAHETMPEKATNRNSCFSCEFRRFCNDV